MLSSNQLALIIAVVAMIPIIIQMMAWLFIRRALIDLHLSLNSRVTELIEVARTAARLEGMRQGQQEEREIGHERAR